MKNTKSVSIIGVPYLYGKEGTDKTTAPQVLRQSGLFTALKVAGIDYQDLGDVEMGTPQTITQKYNPNLKYLPEVLAITQQVKKTVSKTLERNEIPLVLGGDHSVAIGSVLGLASQRQDVTVIWIDTHGDFNTSQNTISGRLHGMALALPLGLDKELNPLFGENTQFQKPSQAVLFGGHKFDPGEKEAIEANIKLVDMKYIIRYGIGEAVEKLLQSIPTKDIHVSLDLDAIDKQYSPGTDMSIDGSLTYRELMYTLERLAEKHSLVSMDVVEFTPKNDINGKTANLAFESITTLLGNRIGTYEMYMEDLEEK